MIVIAKNQIFYNFQKRILSLIIFQYRIYHHILNLYNKTKKSSMKKILFPLEKIVLMLFFIKMITIIDKSLFLFVGNLLLLLSIKVEGARPYTPILFLLLILEWFDFSTVQLFLVFVLGMIMILCKIYDISIPEKGQYPIGHRYQELSLK